MATVVTLRDDVEMARTLAAELSATRRLPAPSQTRPLGLEKDASVPTPSAEPAMPEPARSPTAAVDTLTTKTWRAVMSAMKTLPAPSAAMAVDVLKPEASVVAEAPPSDKLKRVMKP